MHGSAGPHQSCKLRCVCCWVPTDLARWQLSSTSLECTQTPGLLSLLLSQRSSFCEWTATANGMMVFPVTFARGLDSRPAGRQGLRKRLVHWLPQPAGLKSGEEKTQRTFLFFFFFFHELPQRSHPSRPCSCLPSLYGHIGFCSAEKFYCFCCSAPASFFFFVAVNKNHSSLSVPFPDCNSGVLMSFTLSSPHTPFLLLLTMAFSVWCF